MAELKINRQSSTAEVAAWCIEKNLDAEIVGRWVWVTFDEKPSAELRDELKEAGFRWVHRRRQWAHNCGVRTFGSRKDAHPRLTYGSVRLKDRELTTA